MAEMTIFMYILFGLLFVILGGISVGVIIVVISMLRDDS